MSTEVNLPELGDGIESGDVLEIFVAVGDVISEGQDIVEMETDKATVPVPASAGGKVTKILVNEGDTVAIGGTILEVETAVSASDAPATPQRRHRFPWQRRKLHPSQRLSNLPHQNL